MTGPVSATYAEAVMSLPRNLAEVERALDGMDRALYIMASNGRAYECRRNGRTHQWAKDGRWAIPIKWGFRNYGRVEADTLAYFRIEGRH